MLILIPIIAMLALEFVVPGKKKVCARFFLLVLGGVIFVFLLLRSFLPASLVDPEGEAVLRVQSQVQYLLKHKGWQEHPVIILVGSSATQYGVNGRALEQLLIQEGLPVTVLQFSLSGANHFERLFMLRLFLEEIGAEHREELKKAPTLLLSEVFDAYDESPLYLFKKEAYTRRAITWFEPTQAWASYQAWRASGRDKEISYWTLWEHVLLNRFAVGSFSSLELPKYNKQIEPFFPLTGTKKTFHYNEVEKEFREAGPSPLFQQLYPGWKSYYQALFQEMGGVVTSLGFYALPTLEPQRRAYQDAFAASLPAHTTMLGPASREVMNSLLDEKNWFDGVHPQGQGAVLVTRWLAQEIFEKWSDLIETRWEL
ncbi:MAG: hypothetical protein K2W97_01130 [Chthoniobacterales bacterium]|nr:hypothetical protein [Chthoniobacterales bacterium]